MGTSVSSARAAAETGPVHPRARRAGHRRRRPGRRAGLGRDRRAGPGRADPVGYYKDEAKSASTFRIIDGIRYSVPGDFAEVGADGSIQLLGRGSVVHQHRRREGLPRRGRGGAQDHRRRARRRGGRHPRRAVRRGDRGRGRAAPGATATRSPRRSVIDHVKARLAGYKAPRRVRFVADHRPVARRQGRLRPPPAEAAEWAGVAPADRSAGPARPGPRRAQPLLAPCFRTKSLTA